MSEYFKDITDNLIEKRNVSDSLEYFKVSVGEGFNMPIGYLFNASSGIYSNYGNKSSILISNDDIIGMGSMKYLDIDKQIKRTNIVFSESGRYPTPMSKEFFDINPTIFQNITKELLRESKLNKILNQ